MIQALNDMRVLLSDNFSKNYFLNSVKSDQSAESNFSLSIDKMAIFFRVLIHNLVCGHQQ